MYKSKSDIALVKTYISYYRSLETFQCICFLPQNANIYQLNFTLIKNPTVLKSIEQLYYLQNKCFLHIFQICYPLFLISIMSRLCGIL